MRGAPSSASNSKDSSSASGAIFASRSYNEPPVSAGRMSILRCKRMSPVSSPSSIYITVMPLSISPAAIAAWIGAPTRQERGVQIQAGNFWNFENLTWQDLPISHYDDHIWLKGTNFFDCLSILDPRRLQNRYPGGGECFLNRRRLYQLSPSDWFVGLRHNANDF